MFSRTISVLVRVRVMMMVAIIAIVMIPVTANEPLHLNELEGAQNLPYSEAEG